MRTLKIFGNCVSAFGTCPKTIIIDTDTGLITGAESNFKIPGALDMGDSLIFPGFLDVHVHGREDTSGTEIYKEDFRTLGEAAINGGVVHVAEMGNNPKPPVDDASYREKRTLTSKSPVPVTLYAMIGPTTNPLGFAVPYKICHARTTGANDMIFFPDRQSIEAAAERYQGRAISHHCEDSEILKHHSAETRHEQKRPAEAEVSAIDFALYLTERYRLKSKLCHCSVRNGIYKIVAAKARGVDVTCEITPHHLYFDRSMITAENRQWMQMNPPLRTEEDRRFCLEALRNGPIDMIASDHAPHTESDKLKGASGQPHLDTFGAFTTWLMARQNFKPEDILRVCCANPAKFLNPFLAPTFGRVMGKSPPATLVHSR